MKKLEKRATICLLLAAVIVLGLCFFVVRFVINGNTWASYPANKHIYHEGMLATGVIYDRNGEVLAENTTDGVIFNEDSGIRRATVHAVGDPEGNISTGAQTAFGSMLVGYNIFTGTYNNRGEGRKLYLTIDGELCKTANEALAGRDGLVAVYNYETGDILCMVSSPNFDPESTPSSSSSEDGLFVNKFFSSTIVPGSIFKLVTTAACIENMSNLDDWSYTCKAQTLVGNDHITCVNHTAHGKENFYQALSNSCNCAYAELANEIGEDTIEEYVEKLGLNKSMDISGITTAAGSFDYPGDYINLGWTGIGQYHDLINPCSFLTYLGAIAGGGQAAEPRIVKSLKTDRNLPIGGFGKKKTDRMLEEETAEQLADMMKYTAEQNGSDYMFPGLEVCGKSGTAEVGSAEPNAWYCGFLEDEDHPYAFIVLVENGGYGTEVAGPIANKVLQQAVKE